ncbi:hypothetical protein TNO021_210004 [Tenacibaculum dicentrarchi]|nr:hypothetical protein TNO021_210004 [Tenacibaculum dicentrarchi]
MKLFKTIIFFCFQCLFPDRIFFRIMNKIILSFFLIVLFFSCKKEYKAELSQPNPNIKDSITFKMSSALSNFELTLYSNKKYKFISKYTNCFDSRDTETNYEEKFEGVFKINDFKLNFDSNHQEEFILQQTFYILPIKNQTLLIWTNENELKRIKEFRDEFNKPFPKYLIEMNNTGIFGFFNSKQKIKLIPKDKKKVYEIFK